jgi:hypothetical protein
MYRRNDIFRIFCGVGARECLHTISLYVINIFLVVFIIRLRSIIKSKIIAPVISIEITKGDWKKKLRETTTNLSGNIPLRQLKRYNAHINLPSMVLWFDARLQTFFCTKTCLVCWYHSISESASRPTIWWLFLGCVYKKNWNIWNVRWESWDVYRYNNYSSAHVIDDKNENENFKFQNKKGLDSVLAEYIMSYRSIHLRIQEPNTRRNENTPVRVT